MKLYFFSALVLISSQWSYPMLLLAARNIATQPHINPNTNPIPRTLCTRAISTHPIYLQVPKERKSRFGMLVAGVAAVATLELFREHYEENKDDYHNLKNPKSLLRLLWGGNKLDYDLIRATRDKNSKRIRELLRYGANPNGPTIVVEEIPHIFTALYKTNNTAYPTFNPRPLWEAVFNNDYGNAELLIEHGAQLYDPYYVEHVIECGDTSTAPLLMHALCQAEHKPPFTNAHSFDIWTLLVYDRPDVTLAEHLSNIIAKPSIEHVALAVQRNHKELVSFFLAQGIDLNQEASLYTCKAGGQLQACVLRREPNDLILAQIRRSFVTHCLGNEIKRTPLDIAIAEDNSEMAQMLLDRGADTSKCVLNIKEDASESMKQLLARY